MKWMVPILLALTMSLGACSNEGEQLPAFSLTTLDGSQLTAQDLKGKITVINVWATWCGNCLNELDELNALVKQYEGDDSVLFLAVSDETPEKVAAFQQRRPFRFTQLPQGMALTDAIQTRLVKTYPQHIVLDQSGKIAFEATGELGGAVEVLSAEIERLR